MSNSVDLFQEGKLSQAVDAATQAVRNKPSDLLARSHLSELLCFTGDLSRADKQLDAIGEIDAEAMVGSLLLRHLIRSETARREVYAEGRVPEFLTQPTDAQQSRLQALLCFREGDYSGAASAISEAVAREAALTGKCNGEPFEGFVDLDDLLGPTIEIFTATGEYYWLAADQVISLEFSPISHLTDMLWRAAEIVTVGDISGRVHVPALYAGSEASEDERIRIGRATDWSQASPDAPVRGCGQREWLVGDDAVAVTTIRTILFETPNSASEDSGGS